MSDADPNDSGDPPPERLHVTGSKIIRFEQLARCGKEVWIEHEGQLYRLRTTRQGKLVLTK